MNRTMCWIGGTLLLSLSTLPTSAAESVNQLSILNKSLDREAGALTFDLWNRSWKTVTAWRLSLALDDGTGRGRRSVLDQDFAPSPSRGDSATVDPGAGVEGPIVGGEVVSMEWPIEPAAGSLGASEVSLRVAVVVFEDGSFEGDPEVAGTILAARSARLKELESTLHFLRATRGVGQSGGSIRDTLSARARALRAESSGTGLTEGRRREVAAQLSATKLEMAELLESLETATAGDVGNRDGAAIERAISALEAEVSSVEGRASSSSDTRRNGDDPMTREGVQR
jgi:uncharacterized membrane protein